ncbi:MAG: hypothetical protein R3F65_30040 [bacterium]
MPDLAAVRVAVPVQATTLGAAVAAVAHLIGVRMRRAASTVVAYDLASGPLERRTPKGVQADVRTLWPVSPRAERVWVWALVQADRSDDRGQEITASLHRVADGVQLDAGFVWTGDHLDGSVVRADDGEDLFPLREVHSGWRVAPAAGAVVSAPRLLNIPAGVPAGTLLELRMTATDARIVSVSIWEAAPAELEIEG